MSAGSPPDSDGEPPEATVPGRWTAGTPPANVRLGTNTIVSGALAFKRFASRHDPALVVGPHCTMDGVHFDVGTDGRVQIGHHCYFTNAVILSELSLTFGSYVVIGWNTTITDTDFHPIDPARRIADAVACSPLGKNLQRPEVVRRPVVIEDDVWIGPSSVILKGVHVGTGAFIEPGSVVVRDVPARARVLGNPAQVVGTV